MKKLAIALTASAVLGVSALPASAQGVYIDGGAGVRTTVTTPATTARVPNSTRTGIVPTTGIGATIGAGMTAIVPMATDIGGTTTKQLRTYLRAASAKWPAQRATFVTSPPSSDHVKFRRHARITQSVPFSHRGR
jgi:hypothetical protein